MARKKKKFPFNWTLKKAKFTKEHGNVFSCFACGGGSSMGYKLAGFNVIGCNEIDPRMMAVYEQNHEPQYSFLESISTLKDRDDLPEELFNLEILDGSPPCSSFSMAGNRSKDWGKKKKYKEGQQEQVLDELFFDFIDLAKKLKPKVVVAENVKGLLMGNAIEYVRRIYEAFDEAGFYCQHWLLDAAKMGVPQNRERVFFVCLRKDLADQFLFWSDMFTKVPKLDLTFNDAEIEFGKIQEKDNHRKELSEGNMIRWKGADNFGRWDKRSEGGVKFGFFYKAMKWRVCQTILTGSNCYTIEDSPHHLNDSELCKVGSFPSDYDFGKEKAQDIIGMSVPPVMMARLVQEIQIQWLAKINDSKVV